MNNRQEQIEQARRLIATGISSDLVAVLHQQFPELNESEDERIRKILIHIVKGACDKYGIKYKGDDITEEKLLSYLERQKEPLTPEEKMNHPLYLEGFDVGKKVGEVLKEQHPAEWSEEDENWSKYLLDELYAGLKDYCGAAEKDMKEAIKWFKMRLKSLRPQPHWKPSEDQMEALDNARFCKAYDRTELDSLYTDLQKIL